jgi:hypothetical protein
MIVKSLKCLNKLKGTALKDQVETILREIATEHGPLPVRPSTITERLGSYRLLECKCGHADICKDNTHWRDLGERWYDHEDIRPALLKLEREGKVERVVPDKRSGRPHYWHFIGEEDIEIDSI